MKSEEPDQATRSSTASRLLPLFLILNIGALLAAVVYGLGRQHEHDLGDIRKEIQTLNAAQTALRQDIGDVRDLLRRQPVAAGAPAQRDIVLSVADAPFKGNPNAAVTLVEFTDYQCGFCSRYIKEAFPQIDHDYIQTGKLKYVFRNFPLESMHQQAFKAHEAAACAGDQGKFWQMHDLLFTKQSELSPPQLITYAQTLSLDRGKFQSCFDAGSHTAQIRRDIAEGEKAGVTGTPTFFVGTTSPNSPTLKVTRTIVGSKQYSAYKEAIDALLPGAPSS